MTPAIMSALLFENVRRELEWRTRGVYTLRPSEVVWISGVQDGEADAFARYGLVLFVTPHGRHLIAASAADEWAHRCPCGAPMSDPDGAAVSYLTPNGMTGPVTHPDGVAVCGPCLHASRRDPATGCGMRGGSWECVPVWDRLG